MDDERTGEPPLHIFTGLDYTTILKKYGVLKFHMDYNYTKNDPKSFNEHNKQIANARMTWIMMKDRGEVSLWVKNFFDEEYIVRFNNSFQELLGTTFIARGKPRTFGIDYRYLF